MELARSIRLTALVAGIVLTLSANIALSQPTITEWPNSAGHGQPLTLSGTQFGQAGEILTWDNFDSHAAGSRINGLHPLIGNLTWRTFVGNNVDGCEPDISRTQSYSGGQSARTIGNNGQGSSSWASRFGWDFGTVHKELYITFLRRMEGGGTGWTDGGWNHKTVHMWGSAGGHPQFIYGSNHAGGMWQFYDNTGNITDGFNLTTWTTPTYSLSPFPYDWNATKGKWQRWASYQKLNDPYNVPNDDIQLFIENREIFNRNDKNLRVSSTGDAHGYDEFNVGVTYEGKPESFTSLFTYIDDLYVATKRSRVELGDSADFATCNRMDIQIYTAWTDRGINFNLNAPSFSPGETAYLFVVDEFDRISAPREITILASDGSDFQSPTLGLTSPALSDTMRVYVDSGLELYFSNSASFAMSGIAADNVDVTEVAWTGQLAGNSGTFSGTTSWAGQVALASGVNEIRITAFDEAGNSSSIVLLVAYDVPGIPGRPTP